MRQLSFFAALVFLLALAAKAEAQPEDTTQVNLLNRMAMSLRESDHSMAERYAQDALAMAERLGYLKGKAAALDHLGWVSYRKTDFVNTLQYSIEALKIAEKIGDIAEMSRSMNNIAAVSYEQKQFDKAIGEFRKALKLGYQSKDVTVIGRTLNNLAYVYFQSGKSVDSAGYFGNLAAVHSEKIKNPYLVAFANRTVGDVLTSKGNYTEALKHYKKALAVSESTRNNSMTAATYHRIAKVYVATGRTEEAISVLLTNAHDAEQRGYKEELERTYKTLADVYNSTGQKDMAYDYLLRYTQLHDSIYSTQNSKQIALLQNQFDLNLKQAQIEILTKDADLKQKELTAQRLQLYATIFGSSCVLLLVVVMLYSFQKVKRTNKMLEKQKAELAAKNEEIEEKSMELSSLNNTKDKLFSIIGHDLRSPLHSLKGLLELIGTRNMTQEEFELYSKDLKIKIDVIYSNLDNILNWAVTQLNGIVTRPDRLYARTLAAEVVDLYAEISKTKGVTLQNEVPAPVTVYADNDHVRLVIRNLVSNALKFTSGGGVVIVGAYSDEESASIFVKDSGVGIAADNLAKLFVRESLWSVKGTNNEKGLGLGLLLCKEFIEKNNGKLTVVSEAGAGTTITFTLPKAKDSIKRKTPGIYHPQLSDN